MAGLRVVKRHGFVFFSHKLGCLRDVIQGPELGRSPKLSYVLGFGITTDTCFQRILRIYLNLGRICECCPRYLADIAQKQNSSKLDQTLNNVQRLTEQQLLQSKDESKILQRFFLQFLNLLTLRRWPLIHKMCQLSQFHIHLFTIYCSSPTRKMNSSFSLIDQLAIGNAFETHFALRLVVIFINHLVNLLL